MRPAIPVKTTLTVLTFVVLLLVPQAIPSLKNYMSIEPKSAATVLNFPLKPATVEALVDPLASPGQLEPDAEPAAGGQGAQEPVRSRACAGSFLRSAAQGGRGPHHSLRRFAHHRRPDHRRRARRCSSMSSATAAWVLCCWPGPWAWYNHRGVEMSASNWKIDVAGQFHFEGRPERTGRGEFPRRSGRGGALEGKGRPPQRGDRLSGRAAGRGIRRRGGRQSDRHRFLDSAGRDGRVHSRLCVLRYPCRRGAKSR